MLGDREISHNDDDSNTIQPPTSPPLTGSLGLRFTQGMKSATRRLLELPNGIHFRKIECTLNIPDDPQCIMDMVEACSDTLECIDIECENSGKFHPFISSTSRQPAYIYARTREFVVRFDRFL